MTPLEALQAALGAEHAALYCYGLLGARASASAQPKLAAGLAEGYQLHRRRRDQLIAMVGRRGATPVAAEVAYEVPGVADSGPDAGLETGPELSNAALTVERRIARTFGQLIESTAGAERRWALVALEQTAVRQVEFRGTPEMFPGTTA